MNPLLSAKYLLYHNLKKFAETAVSHRVSITGSPPLSLLIEANNRGLYLLGPFSNDCKPLLDAFDCLAVQRVNHGGEDLLKVGTSDAKLFEPVLSLLCDISDRVHEAGETLADAVNLTIQQWRAILAPSAVLSSEAERGLIGELWLLDRLAASIGPKVIDSWQGPSGELHDFLLERVSIEVKTTVSRERIHVISDVRQLVPIEGNNLYILSIQLIPDGNETSITLPAAADAIRRRLKSDTARLSEFERLLRLAGYDDGHRARYTSRFRLRTRPALVPVNSGFPAITPKSLEKAMGQESASRIERIGYSVRLEGLGYEDQSSNFCDILPWHESWVMA